VSLLVDDVYRLPVGRDGDRMVPDSEAGSAALVAVPVEISPATLLT
jgi:hypothetical protein